MRDKLLDDHKIIFLKRKSSPYHPGKSRTLLSRYSKHITVKVLTSRETLVTVNGALSPSHMTVQFDKLKYVCKNQHLTLLYTSVHVTRTLIVRLMEVLTKFSLRVKCKQTRGNIHRLVPCPQMDRDEPYCPGQNDERNTVLTYSLLCRLVK